MSKMNLMTAMCWAALGAFSASVSAEESSPSAVAPVADQVQQMEKALTDVALLVEAARAERKASVLTCLVQKMNQIGKHLRFAKKVEVEQYDVAVRLKDPAAADVARAVAKRLTIVRELHAQAVACAGDYSGYLTGDTVLEFQSLPAQDAETRQLTYGTVTLDSRPPAASPYE